MSYSHFIITRFNLRKSDWKNTKNNEAILDEYWHDHRFDLFENFCFPSVQKQINKNFKWLVYFDTNTPTKYLKIINKLKNEFENFTPFFINGHDLFIESIRKDIKTLSSIDSKFIITTRLDNDDAIHELFTSYIQNSFQKKKCVIDVINGFLLQIEPKILLTKSRQLYNPFISLIEPSLDFETVFSKMHTEWRTMDTISINDKILWIQIIHLKNKYNQYKVSLTTTDLNLLSGFNISISIQKLKKLNRNSKINNTNYYLLKTFHLVINTLVKIKKKLLFYY